MLLSIISRMTLGKNYMVGSGSDQQVFSEMVYELLLVNSAFHLREFIPWLGFLDLQGYVRRMKKVALEWDRFLEHALDDHDEDRRRRDGKEFLVRDMVDIFLNPGLEFKPTRDNVKAIILDLLSAGSDSALVTIEWAISEALKHPNILTNITDELDKMIGKERWVDEKDIHNLTYMDAVVKESIRMHPPGPFLFRLAREDSRICGYDVVAGTRVLVNQWSLGRDPKIWDHPDEFKPERFTGKTIDMKGNNLEFLPFGSGRRMCPAYSLGQKMILLTLANILHGFNWRLKDNLDIKDLSMEENFGITLSRKSPLEAIAEPRLPLYMYQM